MDHDDSVIPVDPGPAADPTRARTRDLGPAARRQRAHRGRARPDVLVVIAAGGMLGASARYGLGQWLPTNPGRFPWATFWTNMTGSFLLGLFLVLILERFPPSRYLRPLVATGVLGAFTTMSTYAVETALLAKDGRPLMALLYGGGSLSAGLALAYAGVLAGRLIPPRHQEIAP
jgi:CrcB protein